MNRRVSQTSLTLNLVAMGRVKVSSKRNGDVPAKRINTNILTSFEKVYKKRRNEINANKSKVDIDLYAKLNSQVLVPHKTDKYQGNKNYENGNVASPSRTKNKSKKKKAKHPQKKIENVDTMDNEKESFSIGKY